MTVMDRDESLSKSFLLICLSAATLLIPIQQAAASTPTSVGATPRDSKPLMQLPPIEEPGSFRPYEPPSSGSSNRVEKPSPVSPVSNTRLVLKLNERRVYVYRDNKVKARYPVAIGKPGWETPTGTFKVLQMQRNPAWQNPFTGKVIPPGPTNPLGLRWVAFWTDGSSLIGFHGTPQENLMGQRVSHGCVRMRNRDVTALFDQVSMGTTVIVEP